MTSTVATEILEDAPSCNNASLDIFSNIKTDYSIKSYEPVTILPQLPITRDTNQLDFSVEPSPCFYDLSNSVFQCSIRLCLEDYSDLPKINPPPLMREGEDARKEREGNHDDESSMSSSLRRHHYRRRCHHSDTLSPKARSLDGRKRKREEREEEEENEGRTSRYRIIRSSVPAPCSL